MDVENDVVIPRGKSSSLKRPEFLSFQRSSISPAEREKYRPRSPPEPDMKKMKKDEKDGHVSDGEKSDQDLVVDDQSEDPVSPHNGTASPRENGLDKLAPKKEHAGPHRFVASAGVSSAAGRPR